MTDEKLMDDALKRTRQSYRDFAFSCVVDSPKEYAAFHAACKAALAHIEAIHKIARLESAKTYKAETVLTVPEDEWSAALSELTDDD